MSSLLNRRRAFTLIEVLVVVLILAILVAALVPSFLSARRDAEAGRVIADLGVISREVTAYAIGGNPNLPVEGGSYKTVDLDDLQISNLEASASVALYGSSAHLVYLYRETKDGVQRIRGDLEVDFKSLKTSELVEAKAKAIWSLYRHESEAKRLIVQIVFVPVG